MAPGTPPGSSGSSGSPGNALPCPGGRGGRCPGLCGSHPAGGKWRPEGWKTAGPLGNLRYEMMQCEASRREAEHDEAEWSGRAGNPQVAALTVDVGRGLQLLL